MRISKKYGLNPTIPLCFVCNKEKNEIILLGANNGKEAPKLGTMVFNKEPCEECKKFMKQGLILISVRDGEESDNPYRTGGWVVVKEESLKRILKKDFIDYLLKVRVGFIYDSLWDSLGLPRTK